MLRIPGASFRMTNWISRAQWQKVMNNSKCMFAQARPARAIQRGRWDNGRSHLLFSMPPPPLGRPLWMLAQAQPSVVSWPWECVHCPSFSALVLTIRSAGHCLSQPVLWPQLPLLSLPTPRTWGYSIWIFQCSPMK